MLWDKGRETQRAGTRELLCSKLPPSVFSVPGDHNVKTGAGDYKLSTSLLLGARYRTGQLWCLSKSSLSLRN